MDYMDLDPCKLGVALSPLVNVSGVAGCFLTDKEGNGLFCQLPAGVDKTLCESAVATLFGSSERVISWAHQGEIVSVMLEAKEGKLLLSNAAGLNLVVIAQKGVNLGLLRVSLKKACSDLECVVLGKPLDMEKPETDVSVSSANLMDAKLAPKTVTKISEVKPKVEEIPLPVFPEIPSGIEVPEDPVARADLAFDIYKALFLSLSIGASRVSGVIPTRGMLKRCLPKGTCSDFLEGVEVQRNATLDFNALKANMDKLPPEQREVFIKEKFGLLITTLVNSYGDVMGVTPLKGMTRKEISLVLKGYGKAMKKLGILNTVPGDIM